MRHMREQAVKIAHVLVEYRSTKPVGRVVMYLAAGWIADREEKEGTIPKNLIFLKLWHTKFRGGGMGMVWQYSLDFVKCFGGWEPRESQSLNLSLPLSLLTFDFLQLKTEVIKPCLFFCPLTPACFIQSARRGSNVLCFWRCVSASEVFGAIISQNNVFISYLEESSGPHL